MSTAGDQLRNTSTFLETLLEGRLIPSPAARALRLIHQSEERDVLFGPDAFAADLCWRVLLILYVAEEASFVLAPDIFELLGPRYPQSLGWLRPLTDAGYVHITNEALALTRGTHTRLTAVLMT